MRGSLLIVAVSGRALARAAADAGYVPLVADFFADLDTQAVSHLAQKVAGNLSRGFRWECLEPVLDALCANAPSPPLGVIYGSGFEDRPEILDAIAARWELLGNDGATVSDVNDPEHFFAALDELDIPHPQSQLDPPAEPEGWIAKRIGAAGGSHVVPAEGQSQARNVYFQRLIPGRPVSALFAGDGTRATLLGLSEQWAAPAPGKPWRYGGASQPAEVGEVAAERMGDIVGRVSGAFQLRGLNSADFLLDGEEPCLLEINPRPGATLDIFANTDLPLIDVHINALQHHKLPAGAPVFEGTAASMIVFAPEAIMIPEGMVWPDGAADLPEPGERIDKERPICTLLARAGSGNLARSLVRAKARQLLAALKVVADPA